MNRSETLNGYSVFVAKVREYRAGGLTLSEAVKKAVKECVKENILREFLGIYGGDVINMLSMEFNLEDAKRVWRNDGIIVGKEKMAEEIAEKMLRRGTHIDIVAEDTELSIERIRQIARKIRA